VRPVLILLLIVGLTPALGEVAEAVVHYAVEGHLAHSAADEGDLGELGDEHGCGTTQHRCGCCASQTVLLADGGGLSVSLLVGVRPAVAPAALASLHEPTPPLRPPIRS
jgi:hypothetical protein